MSGLLAEMPLSHASHWCLSLTWALKPYSVGMGTSGSMPQCKQVRWTCAGVSVHVGEVEGNEQTTVCAGARSACMTACAHKPECTA